MAISDFEWGLNCIMIFDLMSCEVRTPHLKHHNDIIMTSLWLQVDFYVFATNASLSS